MKLPPAARAIDTAATGAVTAAQAADAEAYRAAVEKLISLDREQVNLVLGGVLRMLLEERHPDGLGSDDLQAVLADCARAAAAWYPALDPTALLVVIVGALGVHPEEGEAPELAEDAIAGHAPLLIAHLLAGAAPGPYLTASFTEIYQAETAELP